MRRFPLVLLCLTVVACSRGGDAAPDVPDAADLVETTTTTVPTTTTLSPRLGFEQASLEFTTCMREEGIDLPDLRLDAQGRPVLGDVLEEVDTTSVEFRGALATCASILADSGALDLSADPEIQAIVMDQLQQFSECMRDEGLDQFPDPVPGFTGTGSPYPLELIPFNDPLFAQAATACQEIIGSLGVTG